MQIQSKRSPRRQAQGLRAWGLVLLGVGWAGSVAAAAWGLDDLMAQLGKVRSGEATFVEERRVQELDRTLRSSGRLSFVAPDVFVRETLKPRQEKVAVQGRTMTYTFAGQTRTMSLDGSPEGLMMVEAVRGTLTGDRATLERHFLTQVRGDGNGWTLELVPREVRMRGQVAKVTLQGRQSSLREMHVLLPDGDESTTRIEPVVPTASGTPAPAGKRPVAP